MSAPMITPNLTKPTDPGEILAACRCDLAAYSTLMWDDFHLAAHTRLIIDKLEAVERGEIKRLMIFMPPRHGKTLTATQLFPAWYMGRHPDRSAVVGSYSQELADVFGRRVRNFVADEHHQAVFPDCRLSSDSASMSRFDLSRNGAFAAVGRGSSLTGRGANLLLLDDMVKDREEAYSETVRKALHDWFSTVAYTRLQPGGAIVIVQTRWHEDDLAGRLLREQPSEWEVLSLPAIAEVDESFRKAGEALWPEQYPLQVLEMIRTTIGSAAFASLYQQRPSAAEGNVFKREWFRYYETLPAPTALRRIVQSWDTAFKTGAENDYSVCSTWGVAENCYYLLSLWRDRVEFPHLKRQIQSQASAWNANAVLIEDSASGQSVIQELKMGTRFPVVAIRADRDKRARCEAITPLFESGKVLFPKNANWLATLEDELSTFPAGLHDDICDSVSQALNYLRTPSPGGIRYMNIFTGKIMNTEGCPPGMWWGNLR